MKLFNLLLLAACLAGCSDETQQDAATTSAAFEIVAPPPPPHMSGLADDERIVYKDLHKLPPREPVSGIATKIIKEGSLKVRSAELVASKKLLDSMVAGVNGYYESEHYTKSDRFISYELQVRLPAQNFDLLIQQIGRGKDEITDKDINVRNVTETYTDITLRLNSKRRFLDRYYDLVKKAASVKDVLAIEENIRSLEEEIEAAEGRLRYYDNQVAYSNLSIRLYHEQLFVEKDDNFLHKVAKRIADGWLNITDFALGMIANWPLVLAIGMVVIVTRRWLKIYRRGKAQQIKH